MMRMFDGYRQGVWGVALAQLGPWSTRRFNYGDAATFSGRNRNWFSYMLDCHVNFHDGDFQGGRGRENICGRRIL